jgi:cell division transport system permease protein
MMRSVESLGIALSILVAFSAIFIVANTVRITISDRKKTVEIMQLIGATRGYVLTPFVSLGGLLGLGGAALAILALARLSNFVSQHLINIIFLETHEVIAFLLIGLLLGMIGALIATRRYLKI